MKKEKLESKLSLRPPIVAVLGHVDHGKTTLLDFIRKIAGKAAPTDRGEPRPVAGREAGGITQSIGASSIDFKGQKITFIDTPGHAAFGRMRARGGKIADLVILMVAADDGVMPQTIESLEHIKAANVPFIVAINKIDLPGSDIERVKKQLADNGVLLEGYGGEVVAVPISAKTGQGIEDLLEMLFLVAQMEGIAGDPQGPLRGIIIEAKKEKAGPMGTIVVKNGTLKAGDQILAGEVWAKVKGLFDENRKSLAKVEPGEAAEVLGFEELPPVGAAVIAVQTSSQRKTGTPALKAPPLSEEEQKKLKVVLKADTTGSLEAITGSLPQDIVLIAAGIGEITENDVLLAQMVKATIFSFKVKTRLEVAKLAESEGVAIKTYEIIYQFLEDLEKEVLESSSPQLEEKVTGRAAIIAEFLVEGLRIAGCRVVEGKISQGDHLILKRNDKVQGEAVAAELRQKTKKLLEAKTKEEFGLRLEPLLDFKVGDVLISGRF